jgi:hypothetical protein
MRRNKTIKIISNWVLGPLLFLWLCYSIYTQLVQQPHLEQSWQQIAASSTSYKISTLLEVILLMLLNWLVEAMKWQLSMAVVYPVPFMRAFHAVLSGVSFSIALPNRMGEYAGRVLYLPEGSRLKAVPVTLIASISQLLVTLVCGLAGLFILKATLLQSGLINGRWFSVLLFSTVFAVSVLTVFYFGIAVWRPWLQHVLSKTRFFYLVLSLQGVNATLLLRLLSLSFLRYIIFSLQYVLLFSFFKVHVPAYLLWSASSVLFFVMAVIPTIALAELGLRGQVSLQLIGLFTTNSLGVVLTSATAWAINLMLPALAGSFLILALNFSKRTYKII